MSDATAPVPPIPRSGQARGSPSPRVRVDGLAIAHASSPARDLDLGFHGPLGRTRLGGVPGPRPGPSAGRVGGGRPRDGGGRVRLGTRSARPALRRGRGPGGGRLPARRLRGSPREHRGRRGGALPGARRDASRGRGVRPAGPDPGPRPGAIRGGRDAPGVRRAQSRARRPRGPAASRGALAMAGPSP